MLVVGVVVGISMSGAQDAPATPQDQSTNTALSGQVELARLVDLCAKRLDLKIEYDAAALKGAVTLRLPEGLNDQELWALTNRVLASRGFTSIEQGNGSDGKSGVISIVKLTDAPGLARIQQDQGREVPEGFTFLILRIKNQPAKVILEAVKSVLSKPTGAITELGTGGLVMISDLGPRIEQAVRIIETLDVPGQQPVIQKLQTKFVGAAQLATMVTAAATARDGMTAQPRKGKLIASADGDAIILVCPPEELEFWTALISRFDERQTVVTKTYAPSHFSPAEVGKLIEQTIHGSGSPSSAGISTGSRGSSDQWRMVSDELTGTLIITATPSEHEQIAALVERLDSMPVEARRPVRVFEIRNRNVREILQVLSQLLEAGVLQPDHEQSAAANSQAIGNAEPLQRIPTSPFTASPAGESKAIDTLSIKSDQGSSIGQSNMPRSLVSESPASSATPTWNRSSNQPARSAQVGPQVNLTLTADEGTNTLIAIGESRLLGQLEELIRKLDVRQPQVMLEVMIVSLSDSDTLDLGVELKKIEVSGNTIISLSSLFGLGTPASGIPTTPIAGGRGFTGVVLSPGDFSVVIKALQTMTHGRTLSLPKVLVNNNQQATLDSVLQQPFVSVNASNTVATTSFGGSENAGTVITIKPQIAEGDHLVLTYSISLSAFVGAASDPSVPPPKQSNNMASVVTIPDGYTVVVGGLEITSQNNGMSQIPLLGNIPVLGEAFKTRSKTNSRSRFYVFIRSDVLRHEGFEDLKYLSDRDVAGVDIDDGWPVVEPRVIK